MSASTLVGLSAYLFLLVILSAVARLFILAFSYLRFYLSRKERDFYEKRFERLAAEALRLDGPLLLTDQREKTEQRIEPSVPEEKKNKFPPSGPDLASLWYRDATSVLNHSQ